MNAVPGCLPRYFGELGSDELKMLLSVSGLHFFVYSGEDSEPHTATPSQ